MIQQVEQNSEHLLKQLAVGPYLLQAAPSHDLQLPNGVHQLPQKLHSNHHPQHFPDCAHLSTDVPELFDDELVDAGMLGDQQTTILQQPTNLCGLPPFTRSLPLVLDTSFTIRSISSRSRSGCCCIATKLILYPHHPKSTVAANSHARHACSVWSIWSARLWLYAVFAEGCDYVNFRKVAPIGTRNTVIVRYGFSPSDYIGRSTSIAQLLASLQPSRFNDR